VPGEQADVRLTSAQWRFADEHGATPILQGATDPGSVFMYRIDGSNTVRWLVDLRGEPIEEVSFRNAASDSP
jgi:hypothetical protein